MSTIPTAASEPDAARAEWVAVIAVHGVADQKAGDTARAIASLLVNSADTQARYNKGDCDSFLLAVPALGPMVPSRPPSQDAVRVELVPDDAGSFTKTVVQGPAIRPVAKALRQSVRSDFLRRDWIATGADGDTGAAAPVDVMRAHGVPPPPRQMHADLGVAFSDYLLFKAERDGTDNEAYEATRIRMTRQARGDERLQQVDVHEMYWADLSRLSGALPRIVTELFTMVFRLSRLGRDTVDQAAAAAHERLAAAPADRNWARLAATQRALDWAFAGVLANLFVQLLVAGLVIAGLGLAAPHAATVRSVLAVALPALGAWWFCYRFGGAAACVAAIVAALAGVWLLYLPPAHWVVGVSWLALLALLCDYGLRVAEARFPGARAIGLVFLAATALSLLGHATANALAAGGAADLHSWVIAGMRTVEYLLVLIVAWWAVAAVLLLCWFIFGQRAARADAPARVSVATGRLGLFASIASFMMLAMVIWALLTALVELGGAGTPYSPLIFTLGEGHAAVDGAKFLHARYENSTEAFSLVAGLSLLLLLYLILVFVPSVLAEVKASVGTPQTLGRWLSAGYRNLDACVTVLVFASVLAALAVGVLLLLARFDLFPGGWVGAASKEVADLSKGVLKPLFFGTASAAAVLSAFGGVLSRYVPWLRAPLDVALDVDNHFREFPRQAIPRARIFARYVALLEHVVAQGYDRVVIVAHSQGTVISAELLRYLQERARQQRAAGVSDRVTRLWSRLRGRVAILTAGCPLRQLYAARFPHLYEWVLANGKTRSGPAAGDIGVSRWINLYTTGDYVGRWLWCDPPPAVDTVSGKPTLYDPDVAAATVQPAERDVCLGSGAHTHYFEQGQKRVADWIDALVRG